MILLISLLIYAVTFMIFGAIVGYVAGVNRRFELDEPDLETRLGHQESLPPTWVADAQIHPDEGFFQPTWSEGNADAGGAK